MDDKSKQLPRDDFEADHNLVAFFDLLFQIDKRNKEKQKVFQETLEISRVQDQPSEN